MTRERITCQTATDGPVSGHNLPASPVPGCVSHSPEAVKADRFSYFVVRETLEISATDQHSTASRIDCQAGASIYSIAQAGVRAGEMLVPKTGNLDPVSGSGMLMVRNGEGRTAVP